MFNNVNLAQPVGVPESPLFGEIECSIRWILLVSGSQWQRRLADDIQFLERGSAEHSQNDVAAGRGGQAAVGLFCKAS